MAVDHDTSESKTDIASAAAPLVVPKMLPIRHSFGWAMQDGGFGASTHDPNPSDCVRFLDHGASKRHCGSRLRKSVGALAAEVEGGQSSSSMRGPSEPIYDGLLLDSYYNSTGLVPFNDYDEFRVNVSFDRVQETFRQVQFLIFYVLA
jgi:hypothetical protein